MMIKDDDFDHEDDFINFSDDCTDNDFNNDDDNGGGGNEKIKCIVLKIHEFSPSQIDGYLQILHSLLMAPTTFRKTVGNKSFPSSNVLSNHSMYHHGPLISA